MLHPSQAVREKSKGAQIGEFWDAENTTLILEKKKKKSNSWLLNLGKPKSCSSRAAKCVQLITGLNFKGKL